MLTKGINCAKIICITTKYKLVCRGTKPFIGDVEKVKPDPLNLLVKTSAGKQFYNF